MNSPLEYTCSEWNRIYVFRTRVRFSSVYVQAVTMRTRLKSRNESDLTARVLCTSVSLRRNVVRKVTCRKIDESASVCGGHYDDNAPSRKRGGVCSRSRSGLYAGARDGEPLKCGGGEKDERE